MDIDPVDSIMPQDASTVAILSQEASEGEVRNGAHDLHVASLRDGRDAVPDENRVNGLDPVREHRADDEDFHRAFCVDTFDEDSQHIRRKSDAFSSQLCGRSNSRISSLRGTHFPLTASSRALVHSSTPVPRRR